MKNQNISIENQEFLENMACNFKSLRTEKGWSVKELSKISSIDEKILTDMESGQDFEVRYLIGLCRIYGIEPQKIFL